MAHPQRGDIYHLAIPEDHAIGSEEHGFRPWLIVSVNSINSQLPIVVAVPLTNPENRQTGKQKDLGSYRLFRIRIPDKEKTDEPGTRGCKGESLALTEQVRVLSVDRFPDRRSSHVSDRALYAVEAGLKFIFGMR